MEDVNIWRESQLEEIAAMKDEIKKWQTDLKKEAKIWRDEIIQEAKEWKEEIDNEIETIKGEVRNGYKGSTRKSTGSKDLLGSSTGESDQTEADNVTGRKRRSSPSGTN